MATNSSFAYLDICTAQGEGDGEEGEAQSPGVTVTPEHTMAHCAPTPSIPLLLHHTQHTASCLPASRTWLPLQLGPRTDIAKLSAHEPRPGSDLLHGDSSLPLPSPTPFDTNMDTSSWLIDSTWHTVGSLEVVPDNNKGFFGDNSSLLAHGLLWRKGFSQPQDGRWYCEGGGLGTECQLDLETASFPDPFLEPGTLRWESAWEHRALQSLETEDPY